MDKFWMVWVEATTNISHQHPNNTEAFKEAERLAKLCPGKKVFILEATDCCLVESVKWQKLF